MPYHNVSDMRDILYIIVILLIVQITDCSGGGTDLEVPLNLVL